VLEFLLRERGLSAKDLWPLVGSKGNTSEILSGKLVQTTDEPPSVLVSLEKQK
jgi:antitoxin component HigA of HigAB toxin-antitoxin module